jgi:AcrR family transcriptional regulator
VSKDRPNRPRRTRRSGEEVRSRLLTAGRQIFAERGYAGASTREVAERADVTEVLLFRHFGSKAGLFDEAVLEPFARFVDEWASRWERLKISDESMEQLSREYIDLLYRFFEDNRQLVVALLSARSHHPSADDRLDELFARLEQTVRDGAARYRLPIRNPTTTVRLTFGMVLSAVVHSQILFPAKSALTPEQTIDEITRYMLYGIADIP